MLSRFNFPAQTPDPGQQCVRRRQILHGPKRRPRRDAAAAGAGSRGGQRRRFRRRQHTSGAFMDGGLD